jgi:signal transduction histidine kinase
MKLNIQNLQSQKDLPEPMLHDRLQFLVEMVDMMTQDIRSISHALLPPVLVDFGLEAALNHLCFLTNSNDKVKVEFFASPNEERLAPQTELGLYRIAQELLNNAIKYSEAKTITVQLFRHPHSIVLTVEDDGVGFDEQELKQKMKGLGILDVQGRVKSLDGQFTLESAPNEGVLAMVEVPLKKLANDERSKLAADITG